jgi:hypothetical protein
MQFYTYAHSKPNGSLFYIGKGQKNRAYTYGNRNKYWKRIVEKHGHPTVEILAYWKTAEEAYDHEKLLISCFRDMGYKLANLSDGGEGAAGTKHSQETKDYLRKINLERVLTEEQRAKISAAGKRKKYSAEARKKISIGNTGKVRSAEHKAAISARHKGKKQSPEQIEKRIAARLATIAARKNERKVTS